MPADDAGDLDKWGGWADDIHAMGALTAESDEIHDADDDEEGNTSAGDKLGTKRLSKKHGGGRRRKEGGSD